MPDSRKRELSLVVIVSDQAMLVEALVTVLAREGVEVRGAGPGELGGLLAAGSGRRAGVALVDLDLGLDEAGRPRDAGALIGMLTRRGWRVLVLTGFADLDEVAAAITAGAVNWIVKGARLEELRRMVAAVASGGGGLPEHERARLQLRHAVGGVTPHQARAMLARLSAREREVLSALGRGLSPAEIAAESHTALGTVRTQIRAVLGKLEVNSQVGAIALARRASSRPGAVPAARWRRNLEIQHHDEN